MQNGSVYLVVGLVLFSPAILGLLLTIAVLAFTRSRGWAFGIGSVVGALFPGLVCAGVIWLGVGFMRELEMSTTEVIFLKLLPLILASPGILLSGLVVGLNALRGRRG